MFPILMKYVFFTWRVFTFLFYSLLGRIIILSSVSMMSSFGVLLILGSTLIHGTISSKVSSFITCITSDFGWIPFLQNYLSDENAYLGDDDFPFFLSWSVLWELDIHLLSFLLELLFELLLVIIHPIVYWTWLASS